MRALRNLGGWRGPVMQVGAGAAAATGVPRFGLWPLAVAGLALSAWLLPDRPVGWRVWASNGAGFGLGLFAVRLGLLLVLFGGWFGLVAAVPVAAVVLTAILLT